MALLFSLKTLTTPKNPPRHSRQKNRPLLPLEPLEPRTLLSRALLTPLLPELTPSPVLNVPISFTGATGVTLHLQAALPFSALLGSFISPAPIASLQATIDWGDATPRSPGTILPATAVSPTAIAPRFNVIGSHTYAKPGTFPITVVVSQSSGPPGSLAPIRLVTTINSTAIVSPASTLNLNGTLTGKYSLAPTAAFLGALYIFTGTGTAGAMGPVSANASVQLPGLTPVPVRSTAIAALGIPTGTLTLASLSASPLPGGSVTLHLFALPQTARAPFPTHFSYIITAGTGAYANATGAGTLEASLNLDNQTFTFTLLSF